MKRISPLANEAQRKSNMANGDDIALLATVPLAHLRSALDALRVHGRVAFGTDSAEIFDYLDSKYVKLALDVYIYASHSGAGSMAKGLPETSWHARYIGSVSNPSCRPESTSNDAPSETYWQVNQLREVSPQERLPISGLTGFSKNMPYSGIFIPRRPLLIRHP